MKGVESEPYTHGEIAERDGWRCQLCRKPVNPRKRYPDQMCASIDHIVPISHGGTDVRANVQLAHLFCNMSKGNRAVPQGEQLRLLG
jgi:5-methylcytosine-specific restriction endonuclease McrA